MASDAAAIDKLEDERRRIEEAKRGHLDAMRPIFEEYAGPLYATVILPRLGDRAMSEDVLRDTFATAIEKLNKFRWKGSSIYAWLRRIAMNKVYDLHRRAKRSLALQKSLSSELERATQASDGADARLMAEEERLENRARIDAAMQGLNPRYALALRLRLIEERSREDCAARMDVTVGNFDVIFFRAVRGFRKLFLKEPGSVS